MAMPESAQNWTVAMLDALPDDGQRYEIIDGELFVTPSPRVRHQLVVTRLVAILDPYVRRAGSAVLLVSPSDGRKGERTSVQPDAWVIERWRPGDDRPEVLADRIEWQCTGATEPLVIGLPDFFRSIVPD